MSCSIFLYSNISWGDGDVKSHSYNVEFVIALMWKTVSNLLSSGESVISTIARGLESKTRLLKGRPDGTSKIMVKFSVFSSMLSLLIIAWNNDDEVAGVNVIEVAEPSL